MKVLRALESVRNALLIALGLVVLVVICLPMAFIGWAIGWVSLDDFRA